MPIASTNVCVSADKQYIMASGEVFLRIADSGDKNVCLCTSVFERGSFSERLVVVLNNFHYNNFWSIRWRLSSPLSPLHPSPSPSPLLTQCDGCLEDCAWGLMAGLQGLPAMGVVYCLRAGWSHCMEAPGYLRYPSSIQRDAAVNHGYSRLYFIIVIIIIINFFLIGVYKPRVRCYETSELCMKFERCLDSESKFRSVRLYQYWCAIPWAFYN